MLFEVDKARISVVSAGQDEEVIMHPTDHPKVGELEHFVHDPHHLHIKTVFAACGQSRVMVGLKIMRMCMRITKQALRYKIWDLGLASKSHYKGKIWAFGTKLGLFWDHFWTFPGLLSRYFHENAKNVRKGQNNALSQHFPFQNISNGQ